MVVAGKLSIEETLAPPNYRQPAGRPKKKRHERLSTERLLPSKCDKRVISWATILAAVLLKAQSMGSVATRSKPLSGVEVQSK
jgi:hypothetical protein